MIVVIFLISEKNKIFRCSNIKILRENNKNWSKKYRVCVCDFLCEIAMLTEGCQVAPVSSTRYDIGTRYEKWYAQRNKHSAAYVRLSEQESERGAATTMSETEKGTRTLEYDALSIHLICCCCYRQTSGGLGCSTQPLARIYPRLLNGAQTHPHHPLKQTT